MKLAYISFISILDLLILLLKRDTSLPSFLYYNLYVLMGQVNIRPYDSKMYDNSGAV